MFGHDGRIGRVSFWLGFCAMIAIVSFLGAIAEDAVAGTGDIGRYVALATILGLMIWMQSAVINKRLHDRNRSGMWYFGYGMAPPGFFLWAIYLHASGELEAASILYILAALSFTWVLIELGFVPGTAGNNRFGPEPAWPPHRWWRDLLLRLSARKRGPESQGNTSPP